MSMAWEVTEDDVQQVCEAHKVKYKQEIFDLVDADEVIDKLLNYVSFDAQVDVALCAIEDQLILAKVITGMKKFLMPEDADPDFVDEDDSDE